MVGGGVVGGGVVGGGKPGQRVLALGQHAAGPAGVAVALRCVCGQVSIPLSGSFVPTWRFQQRKGACSPRCEDPEPKLLS